MKYMGGFWVPDGEFHLFQHLLETPHYADDYDGELLGAAMSVVRHRRVAIDIGANVGLWSKKLCGLFDVVEAFEPLDVARECLQINVPAKNLRIHDEALGDRNGTTNLGTKPLTTFKTWVFGGSGPVKLRTLDSCAFTGVDLIKIDCEGFDYYVLQGALETIRGNRPVVVFEAKLNVSLKRYLVPQDAALKVLQRVDYEVILESRGNFVCKPKEK
jgi:FkbM family methyltransferase